MGREHRDHVRGNDEGARSPQSSRPRHAANSTRGRTRDRSDRRRHATSSPARSRRPRRPDRYTRSGSGAPPSETGNHAKTTLPHRRTSTSTRPDCSGINFCALNFSRPDTTFTASPATPRTPRRACPRTPPSGAASHAPPRARSPEPRSHESRQETTQDPREAFRQAGLSSPMSSSVTIASTPSIPRNMARFSSVSSSGYAETHPERPSGDAGTTGDRVQHSPRHTLARAAATTRRRNTPRGTPRRSPCDAS